MYYHNININLNLYLYILYSIGFILHKIINKLPSILILKYLPEYTIVPWYDEQVPQVVPRVYNRNTHYTGFYYTPLLGTIVIPNVDSNRNTKFKKKNWTTLFF